MSCYETIFNPSGGSTGGPGACGVAAGRAKPRAQRVALHHRLGAEEHPPEVHQHAHCQTETALRGQLITTFERLYCTLTLIYTSTLTYTLKFT